MTSSNPNPLQHWVTALGYIAHAYRLPMSEGGARVAAQWSSGRDLPEALTAIARSSGLRLSFPDPVRTKISSWDLPVIVQLRDGSVGVILSLSSNGTATIAFHGDASGAALVDTDQLFPEIVRIVVARPNRSARDMRVDDYIKPYEPHWLRRLVMRHAGSYGFFSHPSSRTFWG